MRGKLSRVAAKSLANDAPQPQFDAFNGCVEFTKSRWQIEAFLDEQLFNRLLNRPLPLGNERLKIVGSEGIAKKNVARGRRYDLHSALRGQAWARITLLTFLLEDPVRYAKQTEDLAL